MPNRSNHRATDGPFDLGVTRIMSLAAILVIIGLLMLFLHGSAADNAIYMTTRTSGSPAEATAKMVMRLGDWELLRGLATASALLLLLQRKVWSAAALMLLATLGKVLGHQAKLSIGLPRPNTAFWLTHASGPTFPSGHATYSMIVYLSVALLMTQMGSTQRWPVVAAFCVSVLVGVSRVMLGVHWLTDVVAGWSFGAAWALLWCFAALNLEKLAGVEKKAAPSQN